ncbi:MAG: cation:proton antiporter [Burkholderiaceae bacterium]|jgi:CPA2 family monovalent cation:H+ antiporter-2
MSTLELVLLFLLAAVAGVVLFRSLKLPPMLGYLSVGILIGPHALGLAPDSPETRRLGEFGVVFLMFSIGLEFNLAKLWTMRRTVFGLGLAQVVLTIVATVGAGWVLAVWPGGKAALPIATWFALGAALAMSSTAIVVKLMKDRLEIESAHGREIVGVLLFQDLAVVLLLVLIPAISEPPTDLVSTLARAGLKAAVLLALLLVFGQRLMRAWFHIVARRRSQELFMLNILLTTLGLAWLTERAGLSLALGAFVAGMLIAETEYHHQVEEDIKPFRDVLLGLFFISIGMLLNVGVVANHLALVVLLLVGPVLLKLLLVTALARAFGCPTGTAIRIGLALAQAGEFGFVLLQQAGALGIIDPLFLQAVLASMLLSMLCAPLAIHYSDRIVLKVSAGEWLRQSVALTQIASRGLAVQKHVIVCGFGRSGQSLAKLLEQEHMTYLALDLDPDRVREAAAAGDNVVYGDASRREYLLAAGIHRAACLVISYADTPSALRVLDHAHALRPDLPVIVRTFDDTDLDQLRAAGASEVVPEIIEGSLMLATHALLLLGIPVSRVVRLVRHVREERYSLLRGFFHGADDPAGLSEALQLRLHSVTIPEAAWSVGKSLEELALDQLEVTVTALRRDAVRTMDPPPKMCLCAGDSLVLRGTAEAVELAEQSLLAPGILHFRRAHGPS